MQQDKISLIIRLREDGKKLSNCLLTIEATNNTNLLHEIFIIDSSNNFNLNELKDLGTSLSDLIQVCGSDFEAITGSTAEYLAFTHSSCLATVGWLTTGLELVTKTDVVAVTGPINSTDDCSNFERAAFFILAHPLFSTGSKEFIREKVEKNVDFLNESNFLIKKEHLIENEYLKGIEPEWSEITLLLLSGGGRILFSPEFSLLQSTLLKPGPLCKMIVQLFLKKVKTSGKEGSSSNIGNYIMGSALPLLSIIAVMLLLFDFATFRFYIFCLAAILIFIANDARSVYKSVNVALVTPYVIAIILGAWSLGFFRLLTFSNDN